MRANGQAIDSTLPKLQLIILCKILNYKTEILSLNTF